MVYLISICFEWDQEDVPLRTIGCNFSKNLITWFTFFYFSQFNVSDEVILLWEFKVLVRSSVCWRKDFILLWAKTSRTEKNLPSLHCFYKTWYLEASPGSSDRALISGEKIVQSSCLIIYKDENELVFGNDILTKTCM